MNKILILGLIVLIVALVVGCETTKFQNPPCETDADCSVMHNGICVDGVCQVGSSDDSLELDELDDFDELEDDLNLDELDSFLD